MTLIIRSNHNSPQFDSYLERKSKKPNTFIVQFPIDPKDNQLLVGACRHNLFKTFQKCREGAVKVIVIPGHGAENSYRASYQQISSSSFDIGGLAQIVHRVIGDRIHQVKIYSCYSGNGPNCLAARVSQYIQAPVIGFLSPIMATPGVSTPVPKTESVTSRIGYLECVRIDHSEPLWFGRRTTSALYERLLGKMLESERELNKEELNRDKRTFRGGTLEMPAQI